MFGRQKSLTKILSGLDKMKGELHAYHDRAAARADVKRVHIDAARQIVAAHEAELNSHIFDQEAAQTWIKWLPVIPVKSS